MVEVGVSLGVFVVVAVGELVTVGVGPPTMVKSASDMSEEDIVGTTDHYRAPRSYRYLAP